MKKNIIIVTLAVALVGILFYGYNRISDQENNNVSLQEQLDEKDLRIERLFESERNAIDSANHYRTLAETADHKVDSLMDKTVEYEQEIKDISNIVANVTPSQAYDSLQQYIPAATGVWI